MADGEALLAAIRVKAYYLWEKAGRPEGGDIAFWDEARRQVAEEQRAGAESGASR